MPMDEQTCLEWLETVLNTIDDPEESPAFNIATTKVRSFEDFGMLIRAKGLVVDLTDGTRLCLTINTIPK